MPELRNSSVRPPLEHIWISASAITPALFPTPLSFVQELLKNWEDLPPMLVTSSRSGQGKAELLGHIAQLREAFLRQ